MFISRVSSRKKGWLLYNLETTKLFVSRDVRFYEAIFPCAEPISQTIDPIEPNVTTHQPNMVFPSVDELACVEECHPVSVGPSSDRAAQISLIERERPYPGTSSCLPDMQQHLDAPAQAVAREDQQAVASPNSMHPSGPPLEHVDERDHGSDPATTFTRSQRERRPSARLQDYICQAIEHPTSSPLHDSSSATSYPLSHFVSYDCFSPRYRGFLDAITSNVEPRSFSQSILDLTWHDAMAAEISALEDIKTWVFTSLPPNKKALGCKWVYKTKYLADGSIG